jgi:hypothetical protein
MKPRSDHTHTYDDWQIETYANQPKEHPVDNLDFSKPEALQTRDGRPVRIYATDGGGNFPVHGASIDSRGCWFSCTWSESGRHGVEVLSDLDLVAKPLRVTGWLNVYKRGKTFIVSNGPHGSKEDAAAFRWDDTALGQIYIDAEVQP